VTDKKSNKSRRKLIKFIAAGSGAFIAGKRLPEHWTKPIVYSVVLPAHAQTSTSSICPVFEITQFWYETSPQAVLSGFGQIRLVLTLQNDTVSNFELDGTIQIWTSPSIIGPPALPVVVNSPPVGTFVPGSTFTYDITVDLSGLPGTEVALALRGIDTNLFGRIRPNIASIVSSTSTCG